MNKFLSAAFATAFLALSSAPAFSADEPPATPVAPAPAAAPAAAPDLSDLSKVISHGIELLEKKDYTTFVKEFIHPKMMENIVKTGGSPEMIAKGFDGPRGQSLLYALKAIKDVTPKIGGSSNNVATYAIPPEIVKEHSLRKSEVIFEKDDNHWYLRN